LGPPPFRFVRHVPARRHDAARGTGLRAGVGQTLREETAGRGAVIPGGYSAMAIVGVASMLVVVVRPVARLIQDWQSQAAGPTSRVADGLMRLAAVLRHRAAKAVPSGCLEQSVCPASRHRRPSSVIGRAGGGVARESIDRARRSAG
jgi:hypothetical protein